MKHRHTILANPLWQEGDLYTIEQLDEMLRAYSQNDDRLKDIVDSLFLIYSTIPFGPDSALLSPAQLAALVQKYYDYGDIAARNYPLASDEPPRYLQEILNLLKITPFKDFLLGVSLEPQNALGFLEIFTTIKGLLFWVVDGPNYTVAPTYVMQGALFLTTILKPGSTSEYLLVDGTGTPLVPATYAPLPLGGTFIPLIAFWNKARMCHKLNELYRISAFEAGIPTKFTHDGENPDFIATAFRAGGSLAKRYPCGFTQAGKFFFLRADAGSYALNISMDNFIPGLAPGAGVDYRLIMDESFVQTPFGLVRIPRSIVSWASLLQPSQLLPDPDLGDPVVLLGLQFTIAALDANGAGTAGFAQPTTITGSGFDGLTMVPVLKTPAPGFTNQPPLSGTQKQHLDVLGGYGHQHGLLIGTIDVDTGLSRSISQYFQIQVSVVAQVMPAGAFGAALASVGTGNDDEISLLNVASSVDPQDPRWRLYGVSPRALMEVMGANGLVAGGWLVDQEQLALIMTTPGSPTQFTTSAIIPLGIHLLKRTAPFDFTALNACPNDLSAAWSINAISSVQSGQGTIILNDGSGQPYAFPASYINAPVTIYQQNGNIVSTTILSRTGDQLAQLPAGVAAGLNGGDIVVIDQQVPENSLNHVYVGEVADRSWVDVRAQVFKGIDYDLEFDPSISPYGTGFQISKEMTVSTGPLLAAEASMDAATESKLRYNFAQRFFMRADDRYSVTNLAVPGATLKAFLLNYIANYDANINHPYVSGENIAIAWPAKTPVTMLPLSRYSNTRVFNQSDYIAIQNVQGWGVVPTLVKFWDAGDHTDYPVQVNSTLTFISDKSLTIPGQTKLAGTFYLQPPDTQIVQPLLKITLYQTLIIQGVPTLTQLASVTVDWTRASSFTNVSGILRIDGQADFNTLTQHININFNQTVNFSVEEPGSVVIDYTYNDLTMQHHLFSFTPGDYGVQISHLADTQFYQVAAGTATPLGITPRLEGISVNGGDVIVRWNIDDANAVVNANGYIQSTWVLRGIPWITITGVTYDAQNNPIDCTYTAQWIDVDPSVSSILDTNTQILQEYLPCKMKYAWVDLVQSNIQSTALPAKTPPSFIYYQIQNFLAPDGLTLDFSQLIRPLQFILAEDPGDYRATQTVVASPVSGLLPYASAILLRNWQTGQVMLQLGAFYAATNTGATVELFQEVTLDSVTEQESENVYFALENGVDATSWVVDFVGMIAFVTDTTLQTVHTQNKMTLFGYWWSNHPLSQRVPMMAAFGPNALVFSTQGIPLVAANWKLGDLPGLYVYENNNLCFAGRTE